MGLFGISNDSSNSTHGRQEKMGKIRSFVTFGDAYKVLWEQRVSSKARNGKLKYGDENESAMEVTTNISERRYKSRGNHIE